MSNTVVPIRGDHEAEKAAELKARVALALDPVLVIMAEANAAGMQIVWDALGPAPNGEMGVLNLRVVKITMKVY